MKNKLKSFKDLKIWVKGMNIAEKIYFITKDFPREELYSLTSQMRRSAISIPSNIAEGFKRYHKKEFRQFLRIALGFSAELETQLILPRKPGYITKSELDSNPEQLNSFSKMITSLAKKII